MEDDLHKVQASILRELIFANGTNFASLNKLGLDNNHFTFHLKKLVNEKLVEQKINKYYLTQKGKVFASKLDIDSLVMEKQGTLSVAVTATKTIGGVKYYLIHQRKKEPFYNYYGFVNGKVRFGESSKQTAKREFKEETGLIGEPKIICTYHKMRGPTRSQINFDHFFFVYIMQSLTGKMRNTAEGENCWMTERQIRKAKTFPGFDSVLSVVVKGKYEPYFEEYIKVDEI